MARFPSPPHPGHAFPLLRLSACAACLVLAGYALLAVAAA